MDAGWDETDSDGEADIPDASAAAQALSAWFNEGDIPDAQAHNEVATRGSATNASASSSNKQRQSIAATTPNQATTVEVGGASTTTTGSGPAGGGKKRKKDKSPSVSRSSTVKTSFPKRPKRKHDRAEDTTITGEALYLKRCAAARDPTQRASTSQPKWAALPPAQRAEWDKQAAVARKRKLEMEEAQDAYNWEKPSAMNTATHLSILARTLKVAAGHAAAEEDGTVRALDALCDAVLVAAPLLVSLMGEIDVPGLNNISGETMCEPLLLPMGPQVVQAIAKNFDERSDRLATEAVTG